MKHAFDLVGIGSVVLDRIFRADSILGPESKGMVRDYTEVVGGVTLNHLAWARVLGLRTGLFGRQGDDTPGATIRAYLDSVGIDRSHLRTDGEGSSQATIFVDPAGERCIYMYRAATETTTPAHIDTYFAEYIRSAAMVSTEISQLPLPTTIRVLEIAADAGIPTALDVDIPPSQAVREAKLGTMDEVERAMALATVVKPAGNAAREMFTVSDPRALAEKLRDKLAPHGHVQLVAITCGADGSVLCDGTTTVAIPACRGVQVVDTTGAGDAYLGALLAGLHYQLDLETLGRLANACGAACVEQIGATPQPGVSRVRALEFYNGPTLPLKPEAATAAQESPDATRECLEALRDEFCNWIRGFTLDQIKAAASHIEQALAKGGRLHVTGVGKPEHVAHYGASVFSSTGTPAHFLHATECIHGSAGQVLPGDVVIAISNSGATTELLLTVDTLKRNGASIVAVTSNPDSPLAVHADYVIIAGVGREGGPLGLAPRASVVVQIAVLAVLSVEMQVRHGLTREQYARWHPAGALGLRAQDRYIPD